MGTRHPPGRLSQRYAGVASDSSQGETISFDEQDEQEEEDDEGLTEEEYDEDEEEDDEDECDSPGYQHPPNIDPLLLFNANFRGEKRHNHVNVTYATSPVTPDDSDDTSDDSTMKPLSPEVERLSEQIPELSRDFRILGKIGEGTFSSVYKAIDLNYEMYKNPWDVNWNQRQKWSSPPIKKRVNSQLRKPVKYVALKRIYVTSSPNRIFNELELLHQLRGCENVVSLITALRFEDQIIAVLPYFKHVEFKEYYMSLSLRDIRLYFLSLFSALEHVHTQGILHRDIKPSNFLFDPISRQGVLVDFGLAEYEDPADAERCPCSSVEAYRHERPSRDSQRAPSFSEAPGYLKHDQRPAKRANRAGTRGFRAPEVLFKCQSQTPKIDIWSCGVILLSFLSKRFPFFNSADDIDAMIELTTIFGRAQMAGCAKLHNCTFETDLPSLSDRGMTFWKLIRWCQADGLSFQGPLQREETQALKFLDRCMELNPNLRFSAEEALQDPFLKDAEEDQLLDDEVAFT